MLFEGCWHGCQNCSGSQSHGWKGGFWESEEFFISLLFQDNKSMNIIDHHQVPFQLIMSRLAFTESLFVYAFLVCVCVFCIVVVVLHIASDLMPHSTLYIALQKIMIPPIWIKVPLLHSHVFGGNSMELFGFILCMCFAYMLKTNTPNINNSLQLQGNSVIVHTATDVRMCANIIHSLLILYSQGWSSVFL